jgi:hypothetical protein
VAELARKTKAQKAAKDHVAARHVLDENNAPASNLDVYRESFFATIPCATLFIPVAKTGHPRAAYDEFPLKHGGVNILFGETTWNPDFNAAAEQYFSLLTQRSFYRGASLKLGAREDTSVGGQAAILVHFHFDLRGSSFAGLALFVAAPEQVLSVGCLYRSIDWEKSSEICEQAMSGAEVSVPTEYKLFRNPN